MSTERVDKAWQSKGLQGYSTEAIVGTLGHYGVPVAEADFRKLSETIWPPDIGMQWGQKWKGTGPFKPFPFAAADELWRRWVTDRIAPRELSDALAELLKSLALLLDGKKDAPVEAAFERMKGVRQKVPMDDKGQPQLAFMERALGVFNEKVAEMFDSMAETLVKAGHTGHADAFAEMEEFLLPDRRGIAGAIVRAAKGERDPALAELEKVTSDSSRSSLSRLLAVDGLIHLGAWPQATTQGRALLMQAEKDKDIHLAIDLCARLEHVYKATGDRASLQGLAQDAARLNKMHDEMHPGHRHRHG
ncbi:hypothetical protein [Hyalangium rubrum]|uniref:Uncharacterized protein n=1 Tax=Hyalangium rubrum TaxID=3103134 RepID=A0ABU5H8Y2_9BACT|nr:hypothetical protein [Hyalangium sp. s54d21]MDY7229227.1 hypothetical protein [Hyalangium sp. s54d21]